MTTNWIPGLVVLGLGLIAAVVLLLATRRNRSGQAPLAAGSPLQDELNARLRSLLDQRRALETERHSMDAARFAEEALRLERAAADVLRVREQDASPVVANVSAATVPQATPAAAEKPKGFASRHPQFVGAVWGAVVVGFFATLGVLLMQEEKPREDGGTMTGREPPRTQLPADASAGRDPQFEQRVERARTDPTDLDNVGFVTHELMRTGRIDEANVLVERGLSIDPFDAELRVHRAVLSSLRGEMTRAERELLHLVDTFPDAQEGLLFLAAMAMQAKNDALALEHLERYAVEVPPALVPRELVATIHSLRASFRR